MRRILSGLFVAYLLAVPIAAEAQTRWAIADAIAAGIVSDQATPIAPLYCLRLLRVDGETAAIPSELPSIVRSRLGNATVVVPAVETLDDCVRVSRVPEDSVAVLVTVSPDPGLANHLRVQLEGPAHGLSLTCRMVEPRASREIKSACWALPANA